MYKKLIPALTLVALTGCVSTKNMPIDQAKVDQTPPQSLQTTQRNKPDFAAMTAGSAMFGVLGAVAAISSGNDIIEQNSVDDPAAQISAELAKALSQKYKLSVQIGTHIIEGTKADEIASAYSDSDWVLDIQTVNWSFTYFPGDFNNYRVLYSAKLRLIDSRDQSLLAEGFCHQRSHEDSDTAPSYDELVEQNAAGLKSALATVAQSCIGQFEREVFKI